MSNTYNCFVISQIGDPDSEIRAAADELLDYLRRFGYKVNHATVSRYIREL